MKNDYTVILPNYNLLVKEVSKKLITTTKLIKKNYSYNLFSNSRKHAR